MKSFKKPISSLLISAILVSSLASCMSGGNVTPVGTDTQAPTQDTLSTESVTTPIYIETEPVTQFTELPTQSEYTTSTDTPTSNLPSFSEIPTATDDTSYSELPSFSDIPIVTDTPTQPSFPSFGDDSTETDIPLFNETDMSTDSLATEATDKLPEIQTETLPTIDATDAPTETVTEPVTEKVTETLPATETQTEPTTSAPATEAPADDNMGFAKTAFPILQNKEYIIKLVISDNANSTERLIATNLKKALKKATTVDIQTTTDFEKADKNAYEILIGQTTRTESISVYNSASFNAYGVKIVGNKIVFFFSTDNEGNELIEQFAKYIRSNEEGQFWVSKSLSIINVVEPSLNSIPKFPESDSKLTTVDCGDNTKMVRVNSTTSAKFTEYCNTLKSNGYTEYSKRSVDGNDFRIFTKGNTAINAYFSSGRGQARIIVGPLKDIPSKEVDNTPEKIKPSITMIGPSESTGNGLGLVYQLANGKFLIIDGGHILSDRIYKELRELQPSGKLVVTGWFVSHPHNDHQDSLENFITYHANEVDIENIYFNYANPEYYNSFSSQYHQGEDQKEGARVTKLRELLAKKLSLSTNIIKPHTGQIYTFGSAKVEIISTVEDFLPTKLTHVNDSSMVVRVTVAGQSTMVLADAADGMKDIISAMYGNSLKSDMVTLAHHGTWDTRPALYNKIQGKVLFWPSNTAGAKEYYGKADSTEGKKAIVAALNNATDVFLAKGTDTKLMLPYTPVGNKQAFINSIK